MLNKNDPLIAAVQKVMQTNQAERNAVSVVNEKFGVADRRALPRERQHEWDAAYAKVLTEGVESLNELKGINSDAGARAGYMVKAIGSAVGAKLTGNKPKSAKRMKGLEGAKKKSEADTERRKENASNNETARKVLKDMGRKTGYGKIYDKMFEEEALDEKKNMSKGDIAALKHPKKKITSHDLAALRAGEHKMEEEKKMKDDPCWDTHEMVGMKKGKGGKSVPNCVPVKEEEQLDELSRGTLERYVNKAGDQAGRAAARGALGDKEAQKTFKKRLKGASLIAQKERRGAIKEEGIPGKAIPGDTVTGSGSVTTMPVPKPKPRPADVGSSQKSIYEMVKSVIKEKKMTSDEKAEEKKMKEKLDTSGMKANMQKQYGNEKGKNIYFAKIRKDAMKKA